MDYKEVSAAVVSKKL